MNWSRIVGLPNNFANFNFNSGRLFSPPINGSFLYYSLDSGNTWILDSNGLDLGGPHGNKTIFLSVATVGNSIFTANLDGQVFRSSDNGDHWNLIYDHLNGSSIKLYGRDDTTLFAFASTIYRSTNGGTTWLTLRPGCCGGKMIFNGSQIIAVQGFDVIVSDDNGDTWRSIKDDLPDSLGIDDLVVNNGYLFIGGYNLGLYRRPLSDFNSGVIPSEHEDAGNELTVTTSADGDRMTVRYSCVSPIANLQLEVYDLLGKLLMSKSISSSLTGLNEIQLSPIVLSSGTYICRVSGIGYLQSRTFQKLW